MATTRAGTLTQILEDKCAYIAECVQADQNKHFRVGDRVHYRRNVGTIDRIVIDSGANMYDVRFDQGGRWSYRSVDLRRVKA